MPGAHRRAVRSTLGTMNTFRHPAPAHLVTAEAICDNLARLALPNQLNVYKEPGTPTVMVWGIDGRPETWQSWAECAAFQTEVIKRTYPWASTDWFRAHANSTSPYASGYQALFASGALPGFTAVTRVADLRPGDLIALNYQDEGSKVYTGHMVMVRQIGEPYHRIRDLPGSTQYPVQVIDCSRYPHGVPGAGDYAAYPDTRIDAAGRRWPGLGTGWMMFYADRADGRFTGYRWSVNSTELSTVDRRLITAARITEGDPQRR
jgi:hypothetical protein